MDNPFRDFFKEMHEFMNPYKGWPNNEDENESHEFIPDIFGPNQSEKDEFQEIFSHFDNIFKSFGFHSNLETPSLDTTETPLPLSPRDEMLKTPDSQQLVPRIEKFWYSPNYSPEVKQEDTDLDDQVGETGLLNLDPVRPEPPKSKSYFKSISVTTIRTPDGKIEERKTVKDSTGKVETSVKKILGDQSLETKTLEDQEGVKEKVENYVNMDETSVSEFLNKWKGNELKLTPSITMPNFNEANQHNKSFVDLFKSIFFK